MFMPGIAIVGSYFKQRRTLALSIANVGTGLGSVTFPTLLNYTIPHVGFPWAVRCQALMMLVLAVIACTLLKPRLPPRKSGPILELEAFKERTYSFFAAGSFFFFLALYFSFFYVSNPRLQVSISWRLGLGNLTTIRSTHLLRSLLDSHTRTQWHFF